MYLDGVKFHSAYGKDENGNTIKVGRPKCKDGHDIKRSVIDLGYWRKHPDLHGYIVEKYADGMVEHIQSDDFKEKLASKINKKIDIPFVSEEKEQIFFEKCVDLVTDVIEGLVKK